MEITKQYVVENGIGHWIISNGYRTLTCDDGDVEVRETIAELTKHPKL